MGSHGVHEGLQSLQEGHIPSYAFPESAAIALAHAVRYGHVSSSITHKFEVGGVVLDVRDVQEISDRLERLGRRSEMTAVTVQPMVRTGVEAIVGVTRDPVFGPLIMFGLGDVHVELLRHVVFRVHPLTDRDATDLVHVIHGAPLLQGY